MGGAPEVIYAGSVLVLDGGFEAWRDFALTPPEPLGADATQQEREAWAFRSGLHASMTGVKQAPPPPAAAPAATPKKKKGGGCSQALWGDGEGVQTPAERPGARYGAAPGERRAGHMEPPWGDWQRGAPAPGGHHARSGPARSGHLIDPQLHIWGWETPVYLFLGGVAAGLMVMSAVLGLRDPDGERSRQVRLMPLAVPVILSLGMGALSLDLGLKAHVLRFYATFRPASPMSWGAWILLAIYPATLLLGLAQAMDAELAKTRGRLDGLRAWARERLWALRLANVLLGIALGVYTGILLGTPGARAVWSSAVLGPLFLVSGLSTGAAFMMLFPLHHDEHGALRRWDMLAIGAELALLVLFLIGLGTYGARGQAALALFLGGPYTATRWSLVVVAGLLVPFALEHLGSRRALRPTLAAPLLLLAGGLALRVLLVASGQA